MKEFKPVVTEKYEFEHRDESITKTPPNFWKYRDFDARSKLNEFLLKVHSPSVEYLSVTSLR